MERLISDTETTIPFDKTGLFRELDKRVVTHDSSIQTVQGTANTALSNAANAQDTANTAVTNAATAQTTANTAVTNAATAQTTAQGAVDTLAGSTNFFKGTATTSINGTPSNVVLAAFTTVTSEGINITGGGYFNFSYLGDYLISCALTGDINNSKTDWYQVVKVDLYNAVSGETVWLYNKNIPPLMTLGIHGASPPALVKVVMGDQWKIRVSCVVDGVISNGVAIVRIAKVV